MREIRNNREQERSRALTAIIPNSIDSLSRVLVPLLVRISRL